MHPHLIELALALGGSRAISCNQELQALVSVERDGGKKVEAGWLVNAQRVSP
jgi:hypothetical protein